MSWSPPKSARAIWDRCSRLTRWTAYVAGLIIVLSAARAIVTKFGWSDGQTLSFWASFSSVVFGVLGFVLWVRWFRRVVMWRLRNRLIVTYTFIGVVPIILLLAMAAAAGWGFAGQFATFVITSDLSSERKVLETANKTLAAAVTQQLRQGATLADAADSIKSLPEHFTAGTVTVQIERGKQLVRSSWPQTAARIELTDAIASKLKDGHYEGLVLNDRRLCLRAVNVVDANGAKATVIHSVPVERDLIQKLAADLGHVRIERSDFNGARENKRTATERREERKRAVVIENEGGEFRGTLDPITAGNLPPRTSLFDIDIPFVALIDVVSWENGDSGSLSLFVNTRPSLLYGRLGQALGQLSTGVVAILTVLAVFFAIIELLALIIGVRLTRTMTASIANLYEATEHINRGDFHHRIPVHSKDQIAALQTSFNSMTESLQKLIAEQKEKQRLESELAIAQEVQAQLFPRGVSPLRSLEVFGVCRPARSVSGDYYDFLPLGSERVGIAAGDVSGKGISAALMMATIHSAVRVYEFGRAPEQFVAAGASATIASGSSIATLNAIESPSEVMALLNHHLFHSTPPEKYATLFLGIWDGTRSELRYSNAGHLPPLVIRADGSLKRLETGGTVVGLFDEIAYDEDRVPLQPGDLFVAYSDGLTEPENEFGEFGEERLLELLIENRYESLDRIANVVTSAVADWIGAGEQPDDVTLVLARAR